MENEFSQVKVLRRINEFLEGHTFIVDYPLLINFYPITIKIELTDFRELIRMGEYVKFIMYTIYIVPSGDEQTDRVMKNLIPGERVIDNPSSMNNATFYLRLTNDVDKVLKNFLEYWGQDYPVFCNKVVNEYFDRISESFIFESKMDSVIRKLVSDIIKLIKTNKEGSYDLPSDISEEMTYSFPQLQSEFSIELNLSNDENKKPFVADAEFSRDDDTIIVSINTNPEFGNTILTELTGELNELIAHELTHLKQHEGGYNFPKDPKKPKKYYSQEHELEAQFRGFKRKAKVTGKKLEDVVKDWFETNKSKHKLKPEQELKIIDKILKFGK